MDETQYVIWCSGCSAEPAIEMLEVEWNDEWVSFPVGPECLTRAQENDRIEE
jgi:hypothetical protein